MKLTINFAGKILFISFCFSLFFVNAQETRDPYKWPFSQQSIWNMPIGDEAVYIHAQLEKTKRPGFTIDEDIIVMKPEAPQTDIYTSTAGWNRNKSRCDIDGGKIATVPLPKDFVVSPDNWDGLTPNSGLAVLLEDGRTILQTQPFARCEAGKPGTSRYTYENIDIYGDGYYGMHGGSGLSAIGGALRVGELVPGAGPIKHALKINVFANKNLYYDEETKGYRWPARKADGYAAKNYYKERTKPVVKACRMGALLALPAWMDLDSMNFETEPGKRLAEAFQDYGAYVVDDTAWDVFALITEWGPDGRVKDEFEKAWGFQITESNPESGWVRDIQKIYSNLHVVDNNSPGSIGGGGNPRMPLAPPFKKN